MKDDKTYKYIVSPRLLLKYPNILQPFWIQRYTKCPQYEDLHFGYLNYMHNDIIPS